MPADRLTIILLLVVLAAVILILGGALWLTRQRTRERIARLSDEIAEIASGGLFHERVSRSAEDDPFSEIENSINAVFEAAQGVEREHRERDRRADLADAQQLLEEGQIFRRTDNQNISDARLHQCCKRVVDHRFVVDRQELLGNGLR